MWWGRPIVLGAGLTLICASAHTPCSCGRFGFPGHGGERPFLTTVVVCNGHHATFENTRFIARKRPARARFELRGMWCPCWIDQSKISAMTRPDTKTRILDDGLRYKSKVSGSPFQASASFGGSTMSCYLCGKHRLRNLMGTRRILGKSQAVCSPSCKSAE